MLLMGLFLYIICANKSEPPVLPSPLNTRDKPIPFRSPPNIHAKNKSCSMFTIFFIPLVTSISIDSNTVPIIALEQNLHPKSFNAIINRGIFIRITVNPTGKLYK